MIDPSEGNGVPTLEYLNKLFKKKKRHKYIEEQAQIHTNNYSDSGISNDVDNECQRTIEMETKDTFGQKQSFNQKIRILYYPTFIACVLERRYICMCVCDYFSAVVVVVVVVVIVMMVVGGGI